MRPTTAVVALLCLSCGNANVLDEGAVPADAGVSGDPCGGVPPAGRCASPTRAQYCVVPTGLGFPFLKEVACTSQQTCQVSAGRAACTSTGACTEGALECSGTSLRTCASGAWTSTSCPYGCAQSALGAFCTPIAESSTELLSGTLSYEKRVPNAGRSDWSATAETVGAPGFLVISRYPDATQAGGFAILDTAFTSRATSPGAFSVKVRPAEQRTTDELVFAAAGVDEAGDLAYVVADPEMREGLQSVESTPVDPSIWMWSATLADLSDAELTIALDNGAGAAHVFAQLQAIREQSASRLGSPGMSLVIWLGMGVRWDCGACFAEYPAEVFDQTFDSQAWFGADSRDEAYWADAVTAHELGHWMMSSYGTNPGEGGPHYMATPTFPGQAWSEGWATFFSSYQRGDPVYLDKQDGTMFWFNLEARQYPGGVAWQRPRPSGGLLQKMDENELAAILWAVSSKGTAGAALLDGLAAARMNASPFARDYTRHTWDVSNQGALVNVVDTGESVPSLPDFFDALMCAGFSRTTLDAATLPSSYYPYLSSSPLCP